MLFIETQVVEIKKDWDILHNANGLLPSSN
jgi:hypothetical protein